MDPYYDLDLKERNLAVCREAGGDAFTFVEGSITDEDTVERVFADHDVEFVYHEVARGGVRPSVEQPRYYEEAKVGDARHTHADVSKAVDLLGYEPSVTIRVGVEQFVEWYRANEAWYRPLAAE